MVDDIEIPIGADGQVDTLKLMERLYGSLARLDAIVVTAGSLFRILEAVAPRILPEATPEELRILATATVGEGLRFERDREGKQNG